MLALSLMASGIVMAASLQSAAAPVPTRDDSRFSECALRRIAELEDTSPDKLSGFTRKNANKALRACQATKAEWAIDLDRKLQADPQFADPVARKSAVNTIIGADEAAVMLMIGMKAK